MTDSRLGPAVLHEESDVECKLQALVDTLARHRTASMRLPGIRGRGGLIGVCTDKLTTRWIGAPLVFIDKILKGAKPSGPSVERATKVPDDRQFRTAGAMGIDMPTIDPCCAPPRPDRRTLLAQERLLPPAHGRFWHVSESAPLGPRQLRLVI